jgi:GT2 family glycosyltransferase/SAM-dependent methyltransferase
MEHSYDNYYYLTSCGAPYERTDHWLSFFGGIATRIIEDISPKSVLDAGCAKGFLVEALRDRGVEAFGVDISDYAISQVREDIREFCRVGSILEPFGRDYDLIITIEVLEHLSPREGEIAIENLCRSTDDILFSSTPDDFKEATHQNVQPPEYWGEIFARHGFIRDLDYDATYICDHAVRFVRSKKRLPAVIHDYERKNSLYLKENRKLRELSLEMRDSLSKKYAELESLAEEHAHMAKEHAHQQAELDSARNHICSLEELLSKRDTEILSLQGSVKTLSEKNDALCGEINQLSGEIESLSEKNVALCGEINQLSGEIETLSEKNIALCDAVNHLSAELAAIQQSIIWRTTTLFHTKVIERLLPLSSRRREFYDLFLLSGRILINEGPGPLLKRIRSHRKNTRVDDDVYARWIEENEPSASDLQKQQIMSVAFSYRPLISIITPVYKISVDILTSTIESVIHQTYDHWELCIAAGNSDDPQIQELLQKYADADPRIRITFLQENLGISGNSNVALSEAGGDFVLFLDHDDVLAPFALFEIVSALNDDSLHDLIYSDRDLLSEDGTCRYNPLFKPDWSPDIMLSANYLAHLCAIRREVIERVGYFNEELDGAQDWDLFFRVIEETRNIFHIPKILYHWRSVHTSCAERGEHAKPYIINAQKRVIEDHLHRHYLQGSVALWNPGGWHVQWDVSDENLVSIVIPTKNASLLKDCIESLEELTSYPHYEIIVIDTGMDRSREPDFIRRIGAMKHLRIIEYTLPFNYSSVNNLGVREAAGDLILFLNDDTVIIDPKWLSELVGWALQNPIGVVGAKLLHPDKTIQHAGVILGLTGFAGHIFAGESQHSMGCFGSTDWYRNYHAVTGACMMVRREVFQEVGGFDEGFILCGSDVDFCLRIHGLGYRIVYNPFAVVEHLESVSRGKDIPKGDFLLSYRRYEPFIREGDRYFNPNLSSWRCAPSLRTDGEEQPIDFIQEFIQQ